MRIGYLTDKGRRRPQNEDAIKILDDQSVFMLADGVGGNRSGEVASSLALDELEKYLKEHPIKSVKNGDMIFKYFTDAVKYVNERINVVSELNADYFGMATTLVFAYERDDIMYISNVGDSRVYLISDGEIRQITEDHTYVNDLVKMGAITREEASKHSKKNIITRAIGANSVSRPDFFSVPMNRESILLMCSDGLYDELEDQEILRLISDSDDMQACAERLVGMANNNGGNDNISVICIKMGD